MLKIGDFSKLSRISIRMLRHYDDIGLLIRQQELAGQAKDLARRRKLLEIALSQLGKDVSSMKYNVTLKTLPERYVASVRMVIPSYDKEQQLWDIFMQETAGLKLQNGDPCYTMAIFHDKEFKETDVDVEIQKSVKGSYQNTAHVSFKTVPLVEIASATFKGSYEQTNPVNQAVANWVRDNGYEFAGASFCIYHVSPYETKDPSELVTEVCYPVRRK